MLCLMSLCCPPLQHDFKANQRPGKETPMTSDSDWTQGAVRRWNFGHAAPAIDEMASTELSDLGYEAALPGLQTLYTDADAADTGKPAMQLPKA
jgi:hypothetical protein